MIRNCWGYVQSGSVICICRQDYVNAVIKFDVDFGISKTIILEAVWWVFEERVNRWKCFLILFLNFIILLHANFENKTLKKSAQNTSNQWILQ